MNDLSPPEASAAPTPTPSPPPAEPPGPVTAESFCRSCRSVRTIPDVRSRSGDRAAARIPDSAVTPPPLESSTPLEALPEAAPVAAIEPAPPQPATASPPAPDRYALPLVSEDDPCGPDLDLEGDTEFMNFIAATEGQLPASYYAFNRASIDFSAAPQAAEKLLKRTLDLRLLVLMAKLAILNRDLAGFARRLGNVAWLVSEHWEAANPKAESDDYSGRIAQLATLEDNAVVLMPLQYAPLIETNREGALSYRDQLLGDAARPSRALLRFMTSEARSRRPSRKSSCRRLRSSEP